MIDAITFEVVRNKLSQITEEMAYTLKSISGSPVVTEVGDFGTGLFTPEGDLVTMPAHVIGHTTSMQIAVKSILSECGTDPGIEPDDMFLVNDPYRGALHQSDVVILAPLHWEGDILAWVGCLAHQIDIGAINPGGFNPGVLSLYQEGLRIPGIKIVEKGKVRSDIWRTIMNMVRIPEVALDLKGQIAANNVAKERLKPLIKRYGVETFKEVLNNVMDFSAAKFEERIQELPDGQYDAKDWFDNDGLTNDIFEVKLTLTKKGKKLIFDFSGTSPAAPGSINCCLGGTYGGVATSLFTALAWDIPWNAGLFRPLEIIVPEGSLLNPNPPSPVGRASVTGMWIVRNIVTKAISSLLGDHPDYSSRAMGVWEGNVILPVFSGLNRDGHPFGLLLMDMVGGGCGAVASHDGMNSAGDSNSPSLRIPNVETHEAAFPLLYLFRRQAVDSGGPGKYRGGLGLEEILIPYDVDEVSLTIAGHGSRCPNSSGVFGGLPGACPEAVIIRNCNIAKAIQRGSLPKELSELDGEFIMSPNVPLAQISKHDAIYFKFPGGGGYGDELERDSDLVMFDVKHEMVSTAAAEKIYGVCLNDDGAVDQEKTQKLRQDMRVNRCKGNNKLNNLQMDANAVIKGHFSYQSGGLYCLCGYPADDFPASLVVNDLPGEIANIPSEGQREFGFREYICPGCGARVNGEVFRI